MLVNENLFIVKDNSNQTIYTYIPQYNILYIFSYLYI